MQTHVLGVGLLEDAVQIVDVAGQLADRSALALDDLLVQVVSYVRVVGGSLVVGMGNLLVDAVTLVGQDLLVAQGDLQRGQFVAIEQTGLTDLALVQLANCLGKEIRTVILRVWRVRNKLRTYRLRSGRHLG